MLRKGKGSKGILRIMTGMLAGMCACLACLGIAAWFLQKGRLADTLIRPAFAVSVFAASMVGCLTAAYGAKERKRIQYGLPGLSLALLILAGRWIEGNGTRETVFTVLLTACAAAPALLIWRRRAGSRRR